MYSIYRSMFTLAFAVAFILVSGASRAQATELTVLTTTEPPYSYEDEKTKMAAGYSTDVARAVLKQAGIKTKGDISVLPWARAYKMLQDKPNILAFTVTKTEERTPLFQWVGPIAPRAYWLWALASRDDVQAANEQELLRYQVGGVRDFASTKQLMALGFKEGGNLQIINTSVQNYKKILLNKRIDLLPDLELGVAFQLSKLGKKSNLLKKVYLLDNRYNYYLALSKSTSPDIAKSLQQAFETLREQGKIDAIMQTYFNRE